MGQPSLPPHRRLKSPGRRGGWLTATERRRGGRIPEIRTKLVTMITEKARAGRPQSVCDQRSRFPWREVGANEYGHETV